ncbi:hypothetical protein [Pantoea ananatis]|uniref:hypothetical protein n=1 Tax=Pantoea ananas TaxID=553 RepID=UPI0021E78BE4|nr:hypothetical protein [Pantoea ananatis]MCW0309748.1 hypothetical protein [Pantoea ananatis]MCW0341477.1 hypothetical protein [Pantoea ananatis]MCW0359988.1 hypothetical protein [Pantoea ananatis]MCW0364585.1 hypothetical protein [Pantoea ananatis]MCW1777062.1 hypothetical protein [Pantoea ananatis]
MTTGKVLSNRSSKNIEILLSFLLLMFFCGLLAGLILYVCPKIVHSRLADKQQQVGSLAMVKNNCHGFFSHDDDVSVLVLTSGYVVTVSGCVNADPGTAVMEPITTLTTDGRDIGKYWCINDICYERTDKEND